MFIFFERALRIAAFSLVTFFKSTDLQAEQKYIEDHRSASNTICRNCQDSQGISRLHCPWCSPNFSCNPELSDGKRVHKRVQTAQLSVLFTSCEHAQKWSSRQVCPLPNEVLLAASARTTTRSSTIHNQAIEQLKIVEVHVHEEKANIYNDPQPPTTYLTHTRAQSLMVLMLFDSVRPSFVFQDCHNLQAFTPLCLRLYVKVHVHLHSPCKSELNISNVQIVIVYLQTSGSIVPTSSMIPNMSMMSKHQFNQVDHVKKLW